MDEEIKRLKRLIVISWMALLFIALAVVIWASVQVKEMREIIVATETKLQKPIDVLDHNDIISIPGPQGQQGLQGVQGNPGANALSTNTVTVVEKPTIIQQTIPVPGIQGEKGEKGDKGDPGKSGREVELGKNSLNETVWRYVGDVIWQTVEAVN